MTNRDSYFVKLNEFVDAMEKVYRLNEENEIGLPWAQVDITVFMPHVKQIYESTSKEDIYLMNTKSGKVAILLSYLTQKLVFHQKLKLSFADYPFLDEVARILSNFLSSSSITESSIRDLNQILSILDMLDKKFPRYRNSLTYRYLRIFMVMVIFGNYWNASVVSNFILTQMSLLEG